MQILDFAEWVLRYFLLTPDERLDVLLLYEEERSEYPPLLSRPARMAILQTLISLPVSLTISLYLLNSAGARPMMIPVALGIVGLTSLFFQRAAQLVKLAW